MYIRSEHRLSDLSRVRLLQEAAAGLAYVHGEGIVHGDIKGANILIDMYESARLCDFGSAYIPRCPDCIAGPPTQFHSLKTQRYLSPELLVEGDPAPTQESDVWALGCVLLEVQTGIVPYETENDPYGVLALRKQVLKRELPAHSSTFSRNKITEAVGLVAFECWIADPESRPTARDVVDILDEVYDAFEPTPVPSPVD
ncbi:hypothetical protein FRC11_001039 [Ceratobasidium sp. 423]|nr:hypothetical protein FRC11_001039 [Ceratobasidium sp. 423]